MHITQIMHITLNSGTEKQPLFSYTVSLSTSVLVTQYFATSITVVSHFHKNGPKTGQIGLPVVLHCPQ